MSDELKPQSIDSLEFRKLLAYVQGWKDGAPIMSPDSPIGRASLALIAHIDAWGARLAGVPAGYKLVPVMPTDDMIVAFAEQWYSKVRCIDDCQMEDCYAAMLAAAPKPEGACGS